MDGMTGSPESLPVRCQIQPVPSADPSEPWLPLTALSEKENAQRGFPWVSFKGKGLYFRHTWFHHWNVRKTHFFLLSAIVIVIVLLLLLLLLRLFLPSHDPLPPFVLLFLFFNEAIPASIIFFKHIRMHYLPYIIFYTEGPGSLILIKAWCWRSKITKKG